MTKLLNLDDFAPEKVTVTYCGVEYDVPPLSLEAFARFQANAKRLEEASTEEKGKLLPSVVELTIPTFPKDLLAQMDIGQLMKLVNFLAIELQEKVKLGGGIMGMIPGQPQQESSPPQS